MDILVFSDSHGRQSKIEEAVARQIKKPDAVIFLGDGLRDMMNAEIGDIPLYCVSGNCDTGCFFVGIDAATAQDVMLGGKRIFFTHGHKYGVKISLTSLIAEGVLRGADIILFGHTHTVFEETVLPDNDRGIKTDKPMYIFNPGSIGTYPYSFGIISIDREGRVLLSHGTLA